jgi:hypothetical protein
MPLDESVVAAVVNENFKNVAGMSALTAGIASQNLVSHQRAMDAIREAFQAESMLQRAGVDPTEAIASRNIITSDIGKLLVELSSAVAAIQQMMKGAQTTPPPTA